MKAAAWTRRRCVMWVLAGHGAGRRRASGVSGWAAIGPGSLHVASLLFSHRHLAVVVNPEGAHRSGTSVSAGAPDMGSR